MTLCARCATEIRAGAEFCGHCGAPSPHRDEKSKDRAEMAASQTSAVAEEPMPALPGRGAGWPLFLAIILGGTALVAAGAGLLITRSEETTRRHAVASDRVQLRLLHEQLAAVQAQNAVLAGKLSSTAARLNASEAGVAPLATRVLRSVFTVETTFGLGTAWAAWNDGSDTFLITANHVAQDAISTGTHQVNLRQRGRTWNGTIIRTDEVNDLAVVRAQGLIAPALWQAPDDAISPRAGDKLLLVGSPYGLEGTVTTGIVSRVAYDEIQTDAAANPGNSGGPAVDARGNVVGVLLSGGGENLNFLVPIQRACVTVRAC